jgi:hypothetical protein
VIIEKFSVISIFAGQIELRNANKASMKALADQYVLQGRVIIKVRSDE